MTAVATAGGPRKRGPGRPRKEGVDEAILQSTLDLIDEGLPVTVTGLVERSGVNRAAIYRRWGSLTDILAAALDVGRTIPEPLDPDGDLKQQIFAMMLGGEVATPSAPYPEARFRQRIALVMTDRTLQRSYWRSHVALRRVALEAALQSGKDRGILRAEIDPGAAVDLIAGVAYYQMVVRGESLNTPAVHHRCREALEIVWQGMVAS